MNDQLRRCQLKQLYIAKEIQRICEKNGIKFFLNAGTLLGAVRHNGFIPWDDDLDVGMLRVEYEKFVKIASSELGDEFFLQTWDTDPKYPMPFAKVRLNGTKYIEKNSQNADIHKGIYVDVFPYDNISSNKIKQKIQKYLSKIYLHLLLNKSGYEYYSKKNCKRYIVYSIFKAFSRLWSYNKLHKNLYNIMTKYNCENIQEIVTFGGANSFEKETLKYEWIKETVDHLFEDAMFPIPYMWDEYLTHFYGDYMTPPPKDKRYDRHNIVECDLGE